MPSSWQKVENTPPICIAIRLPHLYRDTFAEVLGSGVVGTPPFLEISYRYDCDFAIWAYKIERERGEALSEEEVGGGPGWEGVCGEGGAKYLFGDRDSNQRTPRKTPEMITSQCAWPLEPLKQGFWASPGVRLASSNLRCQVAQGLSSGEKRAHKLKKKEKSPGHRPGVPGTPGGTNRGPPAGVPKIPCSLL